NVLNPGLFLDQELNRKKLFDAIQAAARHSSSPIRILNLFSYTGSFSVAAACAGARSTTSVDVSARYLAWEKRNHGINAERGKRACEGLDPATRMIRDDARVFLKREA